MKRGIPQFVPERLKLARDLRQIPTATGLAGLVGVTRQAISEYETGGASPTPDMLHRISETLRFPARFFLKPFEERPQFAPFFRSMVGSPLERKSAEARLFLLLDMTQYLEEYVELPEPTLPDGVLAGSFREWSSDEIEFAAIEIRRVLGIPTRGPLPNLLALLEHCGVIVARAELSQDAIDGTSDWLGGRAYVVLNTTKSPARSRFDLAHELGHLVLHNKIDRLLLQDKATLKMVEGQAHRFAGAFLMPREDALHLLNSGSLEEMIGLKPVWQMSVAAMIHRFEDLEILSKNQARRLWMGMSRNQWRKQEPLESVVREERPSLLRASSELLRDHAGMTPMDLIDRSGMPLDQYRELAGLPENFTDSNSLAKVVPLYRA